MAASAGDPMILANLIAERAATMPDLDVLTFVSVEPDGSFTDELRTYRELWSKVRTLAYNY